jgi:CheY-like chemotaxis protein
MCDVLVVEDEDTVRMVLVDMLEDVGLQVREAATPVEAMAVAQEAPRCFLLVTDVDLGAPELNGFSLAETLRQRFPNMPALFVSGRPWLFKKRPLASREGVLAKPFRRTELVASVRALLR